MRATLRDSKVNLNVLMDATGAEPAQGGQGADDPRQGDADLGQHTQVRATLHFVEILWTGPPAGAGGWQLLRHDSALRPRLVPVVVVGHRAGAGLGPGCTWLSGQVHLQEYELDAAIADLTLAIDRNPADKVATGGLVDWPTSGRGKPEDVGLAELNALATKP